MSDLERARAHLLSSQANLFWARSGGAAALGKPELIKSAELNVLAALSWVWLEQEKERALMVGDVAVNEAGDLLRVVVDTQAGAYVMAPLVVGPNELARTMLRGEVTPVMRDRSVAVDVFLVIGEHSWRDGPFVHDGQARAA